VSRRKGGRAKGPSLDFPALKSLPWDPAHDVHDVRIALDKRRTVRTLTDLNSETRPRSLRPRSTSIKCSRHFPCGRQEGLFELKVLGLVFPRGRVRRSPNLGEAFPFFFDEHFRRGSISRYGPLRNKTYKAKIDRGGASGKIWNRFPRWRRANFWEGTTWMQSQHGYIL